MDESANRVELRQYLSILRRNRLAILGITVLAVLVSIGFSVSQTVEYTARASLAFNDQSRDLQALGTPAAPSQTPDKLAAAQATTVSGLRVATRVKRVLNARADPTKLRDAINTEVQAADGLVSVVATWDTAEGARDIANGFATEARDLITSQERRRYEATADQLQRDARRLRSPQSAAKRLALEDQATRLSTLAQFLQPVEVVTTATVPDSPTSPKPVRNAVLALILGLVLGVIAAFGRDALDRRIRGTDDLREVLGHPVLGHVGREVLGRSPQGVAADTQVSNSNFEPFRILRANLGLLSAAGAPRTVAVTSPLPEEGKSTISSFLAYVEARSGRSTLLVECDLRRPTLAGRLGLAERPGLSDYLLGRASPEEIIQVIPADPSGDIEADAVPADLVCITAGTRVPDPAGLLASERFRDFLDEVSAVYDHVLIDTPPLLPVGDTLEILPHVDGVVLCLRELQTTKDQAADATTAITQITESPIGVVITGVRTSTPGYYAYSHPYEAENSKPARR